MLSLSTAARRPRQIRYGLRVGDDDTCVFVTFLLPMKDGWLWNMEMVLKKGGGRLQLCMYR